MANWTGLRGELSEDPLNIGYAGMTDQQAADSLNATINVEVETVESRDVIEALAADGGAEYQALTPTDQHLVDVFLAAGTVDARSDSKARAFFTSKFTDPDVVAALSALVAPTETTRALQVFGVPVDAAIVAKARA